MNANVFGPELDHRHSISFAPPLHQNMSFIIKKKGNNRPPACAQV
jgi:hypothetical protein